MIASALLAFAAYNSTLPQATQTKFEVPFRIADNAIIVDSVVNGKTVSCMFDSGFSGAFVMNTTVNLGKPTGTMLLRDFVGQFEAPTIAIKSLELGGKKLDSTGMEAVMQDMSTLSLSYGQHCDGIMGFEIISHNIVEINFQQKKFIFHPRSEFDITKKVPDNNKTFMVKMLPKGHNSIELSAESPAGKKLYLALDTGNGFYATTHKDVLERTGLWKEGSKPKFIKQSWVASGPVDSWSLRLKDMKIFGVPVKDSVWDIIDAPSSSADHDGTVGFQFLKNFNVTIDVEQRRVWLERITEDVGNKPEGDAGVTAVWDPSRKRMTIVHVTPEGPAEKLGVKRGDDLLSVDGKELTNLSFDQMREILAGPVGSKVSLATSRDGNLLRYDIERVPLVNEP